MKPQLTRFWIFFLVAGLAWLIIYCAKPAAIYKRVPGTDNYAYDYTALVIASLIAGTVGYGLSWFYI